VLNSVVSHYRVISSLGSGGSGVVYRAEDTNLSRIVALKFLIGHAGNDPKARERLTREARTASALNHPNICTIYEVGEQAGELFIAMEFVDGKSLSKLIPDRGLSIESIVRYGKQIASGLEHAHSRGVTHGDLKSLNIIVTSGGDAKILDFGLARRGDPAEFDKQTLETVSSEGTAGLAGTFPYMAPEQFEGGGTSPRTDIWALGIVLYEMTCGSRPFNGENLYRLCTSILRDALPSLPPHTPPGLATVIGRCLEKEPARRYQSAGEVRAALEALSMSAQTRGSKTPAWKPLVLKRLIVVTGVFFLSLLSYSALRTGYFRKQPSRTLLGVLVLPGNGDAAQSAFENGLAETLNSRLGDLNADRLTVIPTSEIFEKHISTVREARQQFGADFVLTLNVQRVADRARVNYAIVDAGTLQQVHSGTITKSIGDPFALQDQVFESVASAMQMQPVTPGKQVGESRGTIQPAAYDFYLQGLGYLQDYVKPENIENAIKVFNSALEKDPAFAAAHAGLGEAYLSKYQSTHEKQWIDQAMQNCQQAADRDDKLAAAHICLGRVFLDMGDYQKALEQYRAALKLEPTSDMAQGGLAFTYEHLNQLDDAEKIYKQAITVRPNYWATYNWLGLFYQRHARYEDARTMYSQVISLVPDSFTGYSNLGGVYVQQGHYSESIPLLQQSLSIRPTAEASSNLATAYFQLHRYPEAATEFERAVRLDNKDYQMWGNLGDAYFWSDRRDEARKAYKQAIVLGEEKLLVNPRDFEVLSYVAMYHAMCGEREEANRNLDAALRLNSKSPDLLFTAGIVYQQLGETSRALDSLERAVEAGISPATLSDTPNFDSLRSNPRFQKLIHR
jgi:eukaryotic-like serine/threonine-protein kinase